MFEPIERKLHVKPQTQATNQQFKVPLLVDKNHEKGVLTMPKKHQLVFQPRHRTHALNTTPTSLHYQSLHIDDKEPKT